MSPVWSAETLARLRELVAEGLSSTAIAAKLGLTRNAVCGARNAFLWTTGGGGATILRGARAAIASMK